MRSNSKENPKGARRWCLGLSGKMKLLFGLLAFAALLFFTVQLPESENVGSTGATFESATYTESQYWATVTNWETSFFHPVWGRLSFFVTELLWRIPLLEGVVQSIGNFAGLLVVGLAKSNEMGGTFAVIKIALGGPWTAQMHHAWYHFDKRLAVALTEEFPETSSVLDVGCGLGSFLRTFHEHKVATCHGLEPADMSEYWPAGVKQIKENIFAESKVDVDWSVFLPKYDLVLNLEMAEHIPIEWHPVLFDFLTERAQSHIVFSAAAPFQFGSGHITQRPIRHYRAEFEKRGFKEDEALSRKMRTAAKYGWFQNNLLVLKRVK